MMERIMKDMLPPAFDDLVKLSRGESTQKMLAALLKTQGSDEVTSAIKLASALGHLLVEQCAVMEDVYGSYGLYLAAVEDMLRQLLIEGPPKERAS